MSFFKLWGKIVFLDFKKKDVSGAGLGSKEFNEGTVAKRWENVLYWSKGIPYLYLIKSANTKRGLKLGIIIIYDKTILSRGP